MRPLLEYLRKPEWIAAIALSIQGLIFLLQAAFLAWQAAILRRHAATLEKHTEIAGTQAETAALIGKALDQQGKILAEQTEIMDAQFKFQRTVEMKAERWAYSIRWYNYITASSCYFQRFQKCSCQTTRMRCKIG